MEHVVGQTLHENQQLIIQIADADAAPEAPAVEMQRPQTLADWTNVYDGLSDEQIDAIDEIIKTRANLTRSLP